MHPVTLVLTLLLLAVADQSANAQAPIGPATDTSAESFASYVQQQRQLLATFHIEPIIIPRGERVGDSFDRASSTLIAGVDDCFPKLKIRTDSGQLPSMTTQSNRGLAAALGASGILQAEGEGSINQLYVLSYRDVEVRTVSVVQLRNAILPKSAQECEMVRPYLQALGSSKSRATDLGMPVPGLKQPTRRIASVVTDTKPPPIPLLIGTVYHARRVLRVGLARNLDANARLSMGQKVLQVMGLETKFKVSAQGGSSEALEFIGDSVIPVAYAPAFTVTASDVAEGGKTTVQIAEINPEEIRLNVVLTEAILNKNNLVAGTSRYGRYVVTETPAFVLGTGRI
jgi:hypothetical protein